VLAATRLPLVVFDTTPAAAFGPEQDPGEIMFNHGIHGVQDLCNLLRRRGKDFAVAAGHWRESDALERVCGLLRAAAMAATMRTCRIGRIGPPFRGMGDFSLPDGVYALRAGFTVVPYDQRKTPRFFPRPDDPAVAREVAADRERFDCSGVDETLHARSVRTGLAVRRWMEEERLSGFSFNFLSVERDGAFPTVPFLEAAKAMARGAGYAGEGDVLTAALCAALASVRPEVSFTEMFCPDWRGGTIFLSRMGEINPALAAGRAALARRPAFGGDTDVVVAAGRFKPGRAAIVNCAPGPEDHLTLIVADGEMADAPRGDRMDGKVRGWFRPKTGVADFLAAFSELGGTHHSVLVYGDVADEAARFGAFMGWTVATL